MNILSKLSASAGSQGGVMWHHCLCGLVLGVYILCWFPSIHGNTCGVTGVSLFKATHTWACLWGCFVSNVMMTSMLLLLLNDSVHVSLCSHCMLLLATGGPWACTEVDAIAATSGLTKLRENTVAKDRSSDIGMFSVSFTFSCSHSSSSSSSLTTMTSFVSFFFLLFFLILSFGLVFVLPGPYQLLSNTFCNTCISSFEPGLSPMCAFPLPDDWWLCRWGLLLHWHVVWLAHTRQEGQYMDVPWTAVSVSCSCMHCIAEVAAVENQKMTWGRWCRLGLDPSYCCAGGRGRLGGGGEEEGCYWCMAWRYKGWGMPGVACM